MTTTKIQVLWKTDSYDIDLNPASGVKKLKDALYKLTGVPQDRQKIMPKSKGLWKGVLKDTEDLTQYTWSEGTKLSMLGTSEGIPKDDPANAVVFIEDMSAKEQQKLGSNLPPGLDNLGNTCYMNSTLQCLRSIPELKMALNVIENNYTLAGQAQANKGKTMTLALRDLFEQMDNSSGSVVPSRYVQLMRATFPQFAQMMPGQKGAGIAGLVGQYSQQDADEYFNALISELAKHLTKKVDDVDFGNASNAIDALFGVETTIEMTCTESKDEQPVISQENLRRLQCKITEEVGTLEDGLRLSFEGELEKTSQILGRNAKWHTIQRLHKLPLYLAVQFNRFYWKPTPDSRDHQGVNCKINKPVKFPFELDIFDFCDQELQECMQPARDLHTKKLVASLSKMNGSDAKADTPDVKDTNAEGDVEMEEALAFSQVTRTAGPGISARFRGIYELFGVVTHKGRASDSGHYMGWVKQGPNSWICYDDEHPSECKDEDIKKLGGETPDWHIAYIAFYRVKY